MTHQEVKSLMPPTLTCRHRLDILGAMATQRYGARMTAGGGCYTTSSAMRITDGQSSLLIDLTHSLSHSTQTGDYAMRQVGLITASDEALALLPKSREIGRASCRERV